MASMASDSIEATAAATALDPLPAADTRRRRFLLGANYTFARATVNSLGVHSSA